MVSVYNKELIVICLCLYPGKGGKNRRRGKNENENEKRELVFKEDGQGKHILGVFFFKESGVRVCLNVAPCV